MAAGLGLARLPGDAPNGNEDLHQCRIRSAYPDADWQAFNSNGAGGQSRRGGFKAFDLATWQNLVHERPKLRGQSIFL